MQNLLLLQDVLVQMMPSGQAEGGQGGNSMFFFMIIATFAILYFMILRPQQKEQKRHKEMITNLKAGDEIVTVGGIHGRVVNVLEHTVEVKISEGTKIVIDRSRIGRVNSPQPIGESK